MPRTFKSNERYIMDREMNSTPMASAIAIVSSVIHGSYQKAPLSKKSATDKLAWAIDRLDREYQVWVLTHVHNHKLNINCARVLALMAYNRNCGGDYIVGSFRESEPELFKAQVKMVKLNLIKFNDNRECKWIGE